MKTEELNIPVLLAEGAMIIDLKNEHVAMESLSLSDQVEWEEVVFFCLF